MNRPADEQSLGTIDITHLWRLRDFDGVVQLAPDRRDGSIMRTVKVHGDAQVAPRDHARRPVW